MTQEEFKYTDERFADLQMLRYKVEGFENLTLKQKTFIYYLQEAALWGRDILFDQNGVYNLRIRKMLEEMAAPLLTFPEGEGSHAENVSEEDKKNWDELIVYLKRVWFSNGIHHHYGCEKFVPGFSREWFEKNVNCSKELADVIFNPEIDPKRVNLAEGVDLVQTSACNYYQGVSQAEAEAFYAKQKEGEDNSHPVMYGMNSTLKGIDSHQRMGGHPKGMDINGKWVYEEKWTTSGKYGDALTKIVDNLRLARAFAEDEKQQEVIDKLISYYETGDLKTFDEYSIAWVENTEPLVDFANGFIECYGDPLGLKCSWESIVNFKDLAATKRTETMSDNAQWFEDHSPVNPAFKKDKVKGVSAKVINAAILAGDLYPASAIGINLPNSEWIRAEHGSKSVTIGNLTDAYNKAAKGNGFIDEFAYSADEIELTKKYGDIVDDLHTDLHECLGHGSGKLLEGVDSDALKAYGSTIEEARADLFALYYLADEKLVELGLTPDLDAYKASYYGQMMNGLLTQMVRIKPGDQIEESHMRNRALIARWAMAMAAPQPPKGEHVDTANMPVMELVKNNGKTYVKINDYNRLRDIFSRQLAEIQRIKSTGDYAAAQHLVETYGIKIDPELHKEILERYQKLDLAPYKGFINPVYTAIKDADGNITDVIIDYTEGYAEQMLRYSKDYSNLPLIND